MARTFTILTDKIECIIVKENIAYIEFHFDNISHNVQAFGYIHFKDGLRLKITKDQYYKVAERMNETWEEGNVDDK